MSPAGGSWSRTDLRPSDQRETRPQVPPSRPKVELQTHLLGIICSSILVDFLHRFDFVPATSKPPPDPTITVEGLRKRGGRSAVESAMRLKEKRSRTQEAKEIRRAQREAASSVPLRPAGRSFTLERGEVVDFASLSSSDRTSPSPSPSPDFSAPGTPASHSATPSLLSEADLVPDAMPPQALFHGEYIR